MSISSSLTLYLDKKSASLETCNGLTIEYISFKENFDKMYSFINFNPDEVEKDEPPIITRIKNNTDRPEYSVDRPRPTFDKLLVIGSNIELISKELLKKIYKEAETNNNNIIR